MDFKKIAERNKILEVRVGSHLFGTDTPDSDLDMFGIFMPCEEMVYGFQRCEEVDLSIKDKDDTGRNTAAAVDRKLHEYRKFVRLAMQNNPNILHVLFADEKNVAFCNVWGRELLVNAEMFPHKGAHGRFVAYADSQRHKMRIKPERYRELEKGLEVLEGQDESRTMGEFRGVPPFVGPGPSGKHMRVGDINIETGFYLKRAKKMIRDRLSKATNRVELFTKHGYDVKFASNLIQLLKEGIELMNTGRIRMPLAYRQDILDVKAGKYSAERIQEWADELIEEAREAYEGSTLPKDPRSEQIERITVNSVRAWLEEHR
jgi:hypothetical protein